MVKWLADACYGFLALNFLWGLTCVIIIWRRLNELSFRSLKAETEFVENLEGLLRERKYDAATEVCDFDFRALPRLCLLMIANRDQAYGQLRQLIAFNVHAIFSAIWKSTRLIGDRDQKWAAAGAVRDGVGHDGGVRPHRDR